MIEKYAEVCMAKSKFHLGLWYIYERRYEDAMDCYDDVIESKILQEVALSGPHMPPFDGDEFAEEPDLNDVAELLSNCLNNRGALKFRLERYEDAIEDYDKALEVNPDNIRAKEHRETVWNYLLTWNRFDDRREKYKEKYYNSNAWSAKRLERLELDVSTCACGNKANLVHHKTYDNFGKEPLSDLVSLCEECHKIYHGQRDEPVRWKEISRWEDDAFMESINEGYEPSDSYEIFQPSSKNEVELQKEDEDIDF